MKATIYNGPAWPQCQWGQACPPGDDQREAIAEYLTYEYEQPIEAARVRASEILALLAAS